MSTVFLDLPSGERVRLREDVAVSILMIVMEIGFKHGQLKAFPSNKTLHSALKHRGISIKERMLYYYKAYLIQEKWFWCVRRPLQSTVYFLSRKALRAYAHLCRGFENVKSLIYKYCNKLQRKDLYIEPKKVSSASREETPEEANRRFEEVMAYYRGERREK
jgi:hypothetical protein